jgi:hypothetical protein
LKQAVIYRIRGLNGNTTIHGDYAVDERPSKRPARIRRCHPRSSGPPFNAVIEIISELQAIATSSEEHRNCPRAQGDWQKDNHVNAAIASYTRSLRPRERVRDCD